MKTALITGCAGFIGSNLIKRLIESNTFIIGIDNLYTGTINNIKPYINKKNFLFIEGDITNKIDLKKYTDRKIDEIFHLASPASPVHYQKDPIYTARTNFIGTLNLLELARAHKAKFLLASTSEVYGDPLEHPQKETYRGNVNPIGPRACYDEGKRIAETITSDYRRKYNIDTKIIRIFNTYGPNMEMNDGRVISNFIVQALTNTPITIYGDGNQTRSFCYIDDLIDGILKMMDTESSFQGPVNLGNDEEYKIINIAKTIIELTNSKSEIAYKNLPEDDPKKRKPDLTLAKEKLGYEPKIGLKEGLIKTIEYFKERLKGYGGPNNQEKYNKEGS